MIDPVEAVKEYWIRESRKSFGAFRQYLGYPNYKENWFVCDVNSALQQFYDDYTAGKKPKLILTCPPQHGKSRAITEFIAWVSGKNPAIRTIFAAFSERLGVRTNRTLQQMLLSEKYREIFPALDLNKKAAIANIRNTTQIQFSGHEGSFTNTTVKGAITGETLDLGIIDDPVKGSEAANSNTIKQSTRDWFETEFLTRFEESAGMILIQTRWSNDDLAGSIIDKYTGQDNFKILKFSAIAEEDELHRKKNAPLFPDHKSVEFLKERQLSLHEHHWEALYQQNPQVQGGNIIRKDWFQFWSDLNLRDPKSIYTHCFCSIDTAQKTKNHHDYSVLQFWLVDNERNIYLIDQIRDRFAAPDLEAITISFYQKNLKAINALRKIALRFAGLYIEDKSSGSSLIQYLKRKGVIVHAVQRSIDKVTRAYDASTFIKSGFVHLNNHVPHVQELLSEAAAFPNDRFDDLIDCLFTAVEVTHINNKGSRFLASLR